MGGGASGVESGLWGEVGVEVGGCGCEFCWRSFFDVSRLWVCEPVVWG